MTGVSSTRAGVVSGYRSLGHVIGGLELFAVGALLLHVLGKDIPAWRQIFDGNLGVAAVLFVAAYPAGLIVDVIAMRLWESVIRKPGATTKYGRPAMQDWYAIRIAHPRSGDPLKDDADPRDPETWREARRWFWTSGEALGEIGALRLRTKVGRDTAVNAALAVLIAAASPWFSWAIRGSETDPAFWALVGLGLGTGAFITAGLWWKLTHPKPAVGDEPRRVWFGAAGLLLGGDVSWIALAPAVVVVPADLPWLVAAAALGPLVVFALVFDRTHAGRSLIGATRGAARMEPW